jgi:hypothetical protein
MRRLLATVLALPLLFGSVAAADLTGSWTLEFQTGAGGINVYTGECAFAQEGERLSGSCGSGQSTPVPVRGSVKGNTATFQFRTGLDAGFTATFTGQLDASETSMKGSWQFVDQEGNKGEGAFTATKH